MNNITPHFIQWPTRERLQEVMEGFDQHNGLSRCIGAIDGTHIPIKAPRLFWENDSLKNRMDSDFEQAFTTVTDNPWC